MNKTLTIGKVPYTPEEAGYDSLYIERLNEFIERSINEKHIQGGSYYLMRNGKLFANNSMGALDYRFPEKPLLPDSIKRIASITKNYTAVAIMQLAERGYLTTQDPVAMHLDEFDTPLHKTITIYNLLTHTSGLLAEDGAFEEPYSNYWVRHVDSFDGNWIKAMLTQPFHCKPNTQWIYSSPCFCILGEVVKRISGMAFETYVMENIVKPLGLKDTFYDIPKDKLERVIVACEHEIPDHDEDESESDEKSSHGDDKHWALLPRAGWGLYSTLADQNIFSQMLLNNGFFNNQRIIGRKSVENLTHAHLYHDNFRNYCWGADKVHEFGLGFEVMSKKQTNHMTPGTYGHEGAGVCWNYADPKENFIAGMFLPYHNGEFNIKPIHRSKYIIWSGLI